MSFQKLGAELDRLSAAATNVKTYLAQIGKDQLSEQLRVDLAGAQWLDGSMDLQNHLRAIIREKVPELVEEAVRRMDEQAEVARADMAAAFKGKTNGGSPRQAPAQQQNA